MSKDLHDIDELFRSGLDNYEATPSARTKEAIDAALDKKEAEKYKRRFIIWKRMALVLLLLLAGFILFDSGVIKTGSGNRTAKKSAAEEEKTSGEETRPVQPDKNIPANENDNNNTAVTSQPPTQNDIKPGQQNQTGIISSPEVSFITGNGSIIRKNNTLLSAILSPPDKKDNSLTQQDDYLQTTIPGIAVLYKRIINDRITAPHTKNIFLFPPAFISKAAPAIAANNNTGKKKNKPFMPYWLLSPFVAYEQAGYKLDSDDPLAVNTIKHREVHEPSFSGGLLLARQFTNRFSLQSGLVYTSTQIGISPQKMYALQLPGGDIAYKFITSSGYAYIKLGIGQPPAVGDSITTSDAKHLLKHISIPLSLKYKMGKNKFTVSPAAGIEANFITSAKLEVGVDLASNREIVTVNKLKGIKSFYWSAITGVEVSCQINKKIAVNVQPTLRYALSPITKDNVVETFPRSFGVRAGVTIKF